MYDAATLERMSNEAAVIAAREEKKPLMLYDDKGRDTLNQIPNIGDYIPPGWEMVNTLMVDSSGFGRPGELALTFNQFKERANLGMGYAIIEEGQFQVYIGEFKRVS